MNDHNAEAAALIVSLFSLVEPQSIRDVLDFQEKLKDLKIIGNENIYKILRIIKTFDLGKIPDVDRDKRVSNKQWRTLRTVAYECYEISRQCRIKALDDKPTIQPPKPRINMFELPSEALMLVTNLFEELSKANLGSGLTVPILNYYGVLDILSTEYTVLSKTLKPIDDILVAHGWTKSGFEGAPNQSSLIKELESLINM